MLLMTCPQGHQWESSAGPSAAQPPLTGRCPVCGAASINPETVPAAEWPDLGAELPPLPCPVSPPPRPAPPLPWPVIPDYEILEELGKGGMGVVYKARQLKLGRLVAVKMLLPDSRATPEQLARFRREAEAVAALRHANFVHIYDIGEQAGRPYFVLEFVEGGSLADRLTKGPLSSAAAARLLETLAAAMHCAHQANILHRDLKPSNILLMADGSPRIADFGLAKTANAPSDLTDSRAILGTPAYMAPEQAQGRIRDVGPASDIHALGAILYESLTGQVPFGGASLVDILYQVVHQPPQPPTRLRPEVPPDLERICLRCLQKEPAQRYASAAELAEDLRAYLASQQRTDHTAVLPPNRSSGRWWLAWAGVTAAAVALLVGVGVAPRLWTRQDVKSTQDGTAKAPAKAEVRKVVDNNDQVRADPIIMRFTEGKLACLALSPDGLTVALGGESGGVELHDTLTGEQRAALTLPAGPVHTLAFSPDGSTLAVGTDRHILRYDVTTGKQRDPLKGHEGKVSWLGFRNGGKTLVSLGSSSDRKTCLKVWDVDAGTEKGGLDGLSGRVELSPDGKYLAEFNSGVFDSACFLHIWEVGTRKKARSLNRRFYHLAFSPDSRTLVGATGQSRTLAGSSPEDLMFLDVPWGLQPDRHTLHGDWVHSLAISPDGRTLASGGHDKKAILWDIATKKVRPPLTGHSGPVRVCFSADGKTLATSSEKDAFVKLWDVATDKKWKDLPGHGQGVVGLWFAPKGQTLAVLYKDQTVKLWRVVPLQATE